MRLHQHVIDVADRHGLFVLPAGFDEAAIAEIPAQPEIAPHRTYDQFGGGAVEGIGAQPDGIQFILYVDFHALIVEAVQGFRVGNPRNRGTVYLLRKTRQRNRS